MKRFAVLLYGVVAYLSFHAIFLYLIGFTGNIVVPKGVDGPLQVPFWQALLTNVSLIALFGVQHSVMARPAFKSWWTKYVPEPIERSTYLIFTFLIMAVMFYFWQPMGGIVWKIENKAAVTALWVLFAMGWGQVVIASFLINHFDLFGLRQVWLYFRNKPYTKLTFKTPFLYKVIRHPLYLGLLLGFWAAPVMSGTRLFFALVMTIYILWAIRWEERDLIASLGHSYRQYTKRVPMLIPLTMGKREEF